MNPVRTSSRILLSSVFVYSGIDVLRNPGPRVAVAAPVLEKLTAALPSSFKHEHVVKLNAVLQLGAAGMLALGKSPRLAALALVGSLAPTTVGGHRFWEEKEPQRAGQQRIHFMKNAAIMGGLLSVVTQPSSRPKSRSGSSPRRACRGEGARSKE